MSERRGRGLVFFALIGLVVLVGGLALWKLRGRGGGAELAVETAESGARPPAGRGTTWLDDEAASDPSGALEGVVLGPDGQPADGALVTLGRARGRNEESTAPYSYMQPKGTAITAGGGRFRIDRLVPGEYAATAIKLGLTPAQASGIAIKAKETARVELRLAAGGLTLSGRVLDVGGGEIPSAKVTAVGRVMGAGRAPALFHVLSDGEGKYRLTLARGNYGLLVEADGYASTNEQVFLGRDMTKDLRLVPAARLSGRVVERGSKRPVPEAEVSLTSAERMDYKPPRDTRADAEGQFTFTGLDPGGYEVMARRGALIGAGKVVALAVAQTVEGVEIEVDPGFTISGRVKDDRGSGIGNVRVSASRDTPPFGQAARTRSGADGSYALEGMLPGNYRISGSEEGYGYASKQTRLLASDVKGVDLVLPAALKVSGRVVGADGRGVEGARVQAQIESGGAMRMTSGDFATTGADGSFELKRIVPGRLTVSASHEGHGAERVGPEEVKAGEEKKLQITLKKGASIAGMVKTADGKPVAGVQVRAYVRAEMGGIMGGDAQDVTGPDGAYRIAGLTGGRATVSASRGRGDISFGGPDQPHQKSFPLGPGEEKTGVDLEVPEAGVAIRGSVVGSDGKPVGGAIVLAGIERDGRAFRGGSRSLKAYSGLDGQFAIEEVAAGTYTLWASHPEYPETETKGVAAGVSGLKLQFPADALISGIVVAPDGKPIPHYTITILAGPKPDEKPDERRRRQMMTFDARTQRVTDPAGAFEIRRLTGGSHELVISAAGGESATQAVTVQAGERKTGVRIQLQPSLRITGRVIELGTGTPLAGAIATAFGSGTARSEAQSGADGSFTIEGAPTGEMVRLSVRLDDTRWVQESKEITIKPGQTTVDAGTIKLLPGNMRERYGMDPSERGHAGASVRVEEGRPILTAPAPDSPAAKAGLKKGDVVLSIDGKQTAEMGPSALSYLMSGKPGTAVTLVVEAPGGGAPRTVTLTREVIAPRPPPTSAVPAR